MEITVQMYPWSVNDKIAEAQEALNAIKLSLHPSQKRVVSPKDYKDYCYWLTELMNIIACERYCIDRIEAKQKTANIEYWEVVKQEYTSDPLKNKDWSLKEITDAYINRATSYNYRNEIENNSIQEAYVTMYETILKSDIKFAKSMESDLIFQAQEMKLNAWAINKKRDEIDQSNEDLILAEMNWVDNEE